MSTTVYPIIQIDMEETLATFIVQRRKELDLKQGELAELVGVPPSYMSSMEDGKPAWPRKYVAPLAKALGVSQQRLAIAAGLIDDETGEREKRPSLLAGNQQVQTLLDALEYGELKTHQIQALTEVVRGFSIYNQRATSIPETDELPEE